MTISKRVREQAAMICAIAASTPGVPSGALGVYRLLRGRPNGRTTYGSRLMSKREQFDPVLVLVERAFTEAASRPASRYDNGAQDWHAQMAEAEALLRCGWEP